MIYINTDSLWCRARIGDAEDRNQTAVSASSVNSGSFFVFYFSLVQVGVMTKARSFSKVFCENRRHIFFEPLGFYVRSGDTPPQTRYFLLQFVECNKNNLEKFLGCIT